MPAHWETMSLGSLTEGRSQRNHSDLPLLSVVRELGVVRRAVLSKADNHNFIPDDLSNYKLARKNDLVVNKMKAWQGSLGIAPCDGIVSPAYYVYKIDIAVPSFAHMLLRSAPYVNQYARASDGVRIGQWELDPQVFKRIPVLLPTSEEQQAIVRFLAWHWDKTIQLIRANRRLVGILNQKSQSLASGAGLIQELRTRLVADVVTGQLDVRAAAESLPELDVDETIVEVIEEISPEDLVASEEEPVAR